MSIRILVIEQDPAFQESVRSLPESLAQVEFVEARTSTHTKLEIEHRKPDLVFADIMTDGLDQLLPSHSWNGEIAPMLVFIAQNDELTMKAIEVRAFDYLIRPVERTRLLATVERAIARIRRPPNQTRDGGVSLASVEDQLERQNRVLIKLNGRRILVKAAEIDWIEAEGNYVRIHIGKESYLQRTTLNSIEAKLDSGMFGRIHRSVIVNFDKVRELRPWPTGEYIVVMRNGKELTLTRGYKNRLPDVYELNKTSAVRRLDSSVSQLNGTL